MIADLLFRLNGLAGVCAIGVAFWYYDVRKEEKRRDREARDLRDGLR